MMDKLYKINSYWKIVEVPVEKETPKGYKVVPCRESFGKRFIKKGEVGFYETLSMALLYAREILKHRILYADKALKEAETRVYKQKKALADFDESNGIVNASNYANIDMTDYDVYNANGIIMVTERSE